MRITPTAIPGVPLPLIVTLPLNVAPERFSGPLCERALITVAKIRTMQAIAWRVEEEAIVSVAFQTKSAHDSSWPLTQATNLSLRLCDYERFNAEAAEYAAGCQGNN